MRRWIYQLLLFVFLCVPLNLYSDVLYSLDFSEMKDGDAEPWFKKNDFVFKLDADDLDLKFQNGRLMIENPEDSNGLLYKEIEISNAKRIRIEWGVDAFPAGVDWEKGVTRDAIMVIVTFGKKKIDSGSFYIPNLPYFIGIFLGEKEKEGKPYTGSYYKKGGRYFCAPCNSAPGETVITDFELQERFSQVFKKSSVPPISSFVIESDSRDLEGAARVFIKKIEFLSE
jgi:hypothetical protein